MAGKAKKNYLDFVPDRVPDHEWSLSETGQVTIHMVHRGFYPWIAQTFFHRPRISHIDLDEQGGFVWQQIDGQRTVGQIALLVRQQFGEEAEPLYDRLVEYMKILYNNRFIYYRNGSRSRRSR